MGWHSNLLLLLGVAAATPARAALLLRGDSLTLPSPTTDFVLNHEVWAEEVAPVEEERLASYRVGLNLLPGTSGIRFIQPGGPHLRTARQPAVFGNSVPIENLGGTDTTVRASAGSIAGPVNVDDEEGFLRVQILVPAGTPFGDYPIAFDHATTQFLDERGQPIPVVVGFAGSIFVLPEPGTSALIGLGGFLMLRRRGRHSGAVTSFSRQTPGH